MKYKVGDKVLVKTKIIKVDDDDNSYQIYSCRYSNDIWIKPDDIIEPQAKIKVPKWFDEWVKSEIGDEPDTHDKLGLIDDIICNSVPGQSKVLDDMKQLNLVKALINGYEVEQEKLYNVKIPHLKKWLYVKAGGNDVVEEYLTSSNIEAYKTYKIKESLRQKEAFEFTQAEIEKYGLQDCEKVEVEQDEN